MVQVAAMKLLGTRNLNKSFGGLWAVRNVDFDLEEGEIRAIIGPNGAGKTTFVSLLSGRITSSSGSVEFRGADITSLPSYKRVRRGIAYTFQVTSIYPNLSAFENVAIAAQSSLDYSPGRHAGVDTDSLDSRVMAALESVELVDRARVKAGELAYGHQRLLEVAMGLALEPALLILDEPTQGLSDSENENFCALVRKISQSATILLIEHNMSVVMQLADKITVFNQGEILAEGTPVEIRDNARVQAAYLGS